MAEKKEKQVQKKPEVIVYCGPSVRGIAKQYHRVPRQTAGRAGKVFGKAPGGAVLVRAAERVCRDPRRAEHKGIAAGDLVQNDFERTVRRKQRWLTNMAFM